MSENSILSPTVFSQMCREMRASDVEWLIDLFLNEIPKYISELEKTIVNQDADALYFAAHKFKGSCANVGAESIVNICKQLEILGKLKDISKAAEIIQNDLKNSVESVRHALVVEKQKLKKSK